MANPPKPRIGFGASSSEAPPALPFRLLAVADFGPAGAESALSPIPVDKESFTEVLRRAPEPARRAPAAPAPARSRSHSDDALDSILDLVEAPPGARGEVTEGAARVDDLVGKMFSRTGGQGSIDRRAADGLIAEID